jgi:predicted nucleic acid-binding protein
MTRFCDSFYFFVLLNPSDNAHLRAVEYTTNFKGTLVTTAWVLTELADGMATPLQRERFVHFLDGIRQRHDVAVVPPDLGLFEEGVQLYRNRLDKAWSLTDCISFIVMQKQGITEALTGDHHFEQAGSRILLKD